MRAHGGEQRDVVPSASPRSSASGDLHGELGEVGQELVQRRVDEPDRRRQAVHRLQQARRSPARCSGSSASSACSPLRRRCRPAPAARCARDGRRGTGARCGTARPPRHRARARRASSRCRRWRARASGVRRRRAGAPGRTASTSARTSGSSRRRREGGVEPVGDVDHDRGVDDGDLAAEHLAGGAVDRDRVAARAAPRRGPGPRRGRSTSTSSAPTTAHVPIPRATTAACDVLPPRAVSTPSATIIPAGRPGWSPGGPGSRRAPAFCARAPGRCPARSRRPRLPGRRRMRASAAVALARCGSNCGNSSWRAGRR